MNELLEGEPTLKSDPTRLTTEALRLAIDSITALFKSELGAVRDVHSEKLSSLKEQLIKTDEVTTKAFEAMTSINNTNQSSLDDKINTLKERVVSIEAMINGRDYARGSGQATGLYIIAILGTIVGIAGIFVAIFNK